VAFTVADYVLKRLSEQHVDTLFGVPAAYCAPLFDAANAHGMRSVVTASELEAGYAADGYARTKGLGAASVAYGVGPLTEAAYSPSFLGWICSCCWTAGWASSAAFDRATISWLSSASRSQTCAIWSRISRAW
jgi:glyoxylate carboligase